MDPTDFPRPELVSRSSTTAARHGTPIAPGEFTVQLRELDRLARQELQKQRHHHAAQPKDKSGVEGEEDSIGAVVVPRSKKIPSDVAGLPPISSKKQASEAQQPLRLQAETPNPKWAMVPYGGDTSPKQIEDHSTTSSTNRALIVPEEDGTTNPVDATALAPRRGDMFFVSTMSSSAPPLHLRTGAAAKKCVYGRKLQRKLNHPLQEPRSEFEVWPAHHQKLPMGPEQTSSMLESFTTKPQLLSDLERSIRDRLYLLNTKYPQYKKVNHTTPPNEEESAHSEGAEMTPEQLKFVRRRSEIAAGLGQKNQQGQQHESFESEQQRSQQGEQENQPCFGRSVTKAEEGALGRSSSLTIVSAGDFDSPTKHSSKSLRRTSSVFQPVSEEDGFRCERFNIFSAAGREFAAHFSTYKKLLLWIMSEFDEFVSYCHQNVFSPETRAQFEAETYARAEKRYSGERDDLKERLKRANHRIKELETTVAQLKEATKSVENVLSDKDYSLGLKERELSEAAEGRAAMLNRISRLEKELWKNRNELDGPEKKIIELQRVIQNLNGRIASQAQVMEELTTEKTTFQVRLEKLEHLLREKKKQEANSVPKSEMINWKKREMEILEQNAALQGRVMKLEKRVKLFVEEAKSAKKCGDTATHTPRPLWPLVEDVYPKASSSAQRINLMAQEYRTLSATKESIAEELSDLKELMGELSRDDNNRYNNTICVTMRREYFEKLGVDLDVPSYLKGNGKARNLKLTRVQTECYIRMFILEKESVRSNISAELLMSRVCSRVASLQGHDLSDFSYSFFQAMHWYCFDPLVGFVRGYILGSIDDAVCHGMLHETVILRVRLKRVAERRDSLLKQGLREEDVEKQEQSQQQQQQSNNALSFQELALTPRTKTLSEEVEVIGNFVLPKKLVISAILETFSFKEEDDFAKLIGALNRDCPNVDCDTSVIFGFNTHKDNRFSNFVEELYLQYIEWRGALVSDYRDAVLKVSNDDGMVLVDPLAKELWRVDPLIPVQYMDSLLAELFGVSIEQLFASLNTESGIRHAGGQGERFYKCKDSVTNDIATILKKIESRTLMRFCKSSEVEDLLLQQNQQVLEKQRENGSKDREGRSDAMPMEDSEND